MSIQDCVNDALNTLRDIATDETVDVELRISAAEKILDYAASLGEYQDDKTDAIGFTIGEREECDAQGFGEYLKSLREAQGLTLTELGELIGTSHSYLSQIENGKKTHPSLGVLKKMSERLGVSQIELMRKSGCLQSDIA